MPRAISIMPDRPYSDGQQIAATKEKAVVRKGLLGAVIGGYLAAWAPTDMLRVLLATILAASAITVLSAIGALIPSNQKPLRVVAQPR